MKSTKLLFWSAVTYAILLVLARGIFSSESTPGISLAGIPLIVIAVIIARDLSRRSTSPSTTPTARSAHKFGEEPVKFLASQISVAANASDSYVENVVRSRLKELLISKMTAETGLNTTSITKAMSNPKQAATLLHNEELYRILYGRLPASTSELMQMVEDAIEMIGAWKE